MQPRTYYVDERGGRATYVHREAMEWYRQGYAITLYREDPVTGELTQDQWIKGWGF